MVTGRFNAMTRYAKWQEFCTLFWEGGKSRSEQFKKLQDFYSGSNMHWYETPGEGLDYKFICPFLWVTLKMLKES